jgi:argininosuccinate synthase
VRPKPGNVIVVGRESKYSLYDQDLVTFEEGAVAYDHHDAAGFIKLNALRLRTLEHDPEKWVPVFRKDHAQTKR